MKACGFCHFVAENHPGRIHVAGHARDQRPQDYGSNSLVSVGLRPAGHDPGSGLSFAKILMREQSFVRRTCAVADLAVVKRQA
jgi:hypothetical protein